MGAQLVELIGATKNLALRDEELVSMGGFAKDFGLNLWQNSSRHTLADISLLIYSNKRGLISPVKLTMTRAIPNTLKNVGVSCSTK